MRICEGIIRENAKWRRGSIRVQGEVDGVAWSWAGPSASASPRFTDILGVGDESPPSLALALWPASIGLKISGRGKLSWRALPSAQRASSAPSHPITANLHPVIQQI